MLSEMAAHVKIGVIAALLLSVFALKPSATEAASQVRHVVLDEGALPSYRWGMLAIRDHGREGGGRPCVSTIIRHRTPGFGILESDDKQCGPLPKGGPPEIFSYSFGDGKKQVTIFALAFEQRVASVFLDLGEAGHRTVRLHTLNKRQQQISGLRPFRFNTFAIRGPFCLGKAIGYNLSGEVIYEQSPIDPCASEE